MQSGGRYLARDRVCLFSEQISKEVERAEGDVPVERLLATLLGELFIG